MKKVLVSFLILIFACAAVFAAITSPVTMNLKTIITAGSNPPDNQEQTGGDEGENNGLFYAIGLLAPDKSINSDITANSVSVGKDDLVALSKYTTEFPYTGEEGETLLTPTSDKENDKKSIDIYLAAGVDISKNEGLKVTISSTNGWKRSSDNTSESSGKTQNNIPISFETAVLNETHSQSLYAIAPPADNGTSSNTITVTAKGPAHTKDMIYLAKTTASWDRNRNYLAGTYTAEIKVVITAGN